MKAFEVQTQSNLSNRILDNLVSAVLLFDTELVIRYLNPSAEMLLRVSARQLIGFNAIEAINCPENMLQKHLVRVLESDRPVTEREMLLRLPDGREMTVDCSVSPISARDGTPGILLEIQQVDRLLRISREDTLLHQQQASRQLIRGMAHEIKNPLGGLRGAAQLLEAELGSAELKEYTKVIIDEADRLQNLVNRMLGPNKLPVLGEINLHQILERVRTLVNAEVGKGLCIRTDYDPSIPELVADADQLIQAFLNLVQNAARAVAEQQGCVTLRTRVLRQFTIGTKRHRLVAQIDVQDNGPGVPPEIRDRLFFPLVTHGTGGSGLGLSIAQSLIYQHSGLIECKSQPGNTVFSVFLPLEYVRE